MLDIKFQNDEEIQESKNKLRPDQTFEYKFDDAEMTGKIVVN
ncbi:MAG TPA: hypothetical protein VJR94_07760 [Candidatus Nitrosocosmicus sp.]|nr:hypothetical protein [Candidatus Nitrosocosmicus sp.]